MHQLLRFCLLLCNVVFFYVGAHSANGYPYDIPFETVEIPIYHFSQLTPQVHLRMEYAESRIENPESLLEVMQRGEVYEIDLVFTKYPVDSSKWRSSYNRLLKNRLRNLFAIDGSLHDTKTINWRLVLQTKCHSEEEAKQFFHGFVVKYKVTRPQVMRDLSTVWDIEKVLSGKAITRDSSVLSIMNRNKDWKDVLVIMDWTGSMYRYGTQVVLWHKLNMETSGIKHLVLFNDGNKKMTYQKKIGRTGGIYYTPTAQIEEIIETLSTVMHNGYGGDAPENDLEAVMKGLKNVDDYREVILIADNHSVVRDMPLLKNIKKPVRVILCGAHRDRINPDYLEIAFKTQGSIHTVEEDIITMGKLKEGDMIEIQGFRYKVRGGNLELFK
ncbi:MAG: hypothetical protein AAF570_11625 [Bacteroidota bacterium]